MSENSLRNRIKIERKIMRRIVSDALNAGFALNVDNGGDEEELSAPTTDRKTIMDAMMQTDDDRLYFYKRCLSNPSNLINFGWAHLVYGNDGWDVLSDYTVNLESNLQGAITLGKSLES